MFPIDPLNNNLIISRLEAKEEIGVIYIPKSARELPMFGKIMARGGEVLSTALQPDAIMLYRKYAGVEFVVKGTTYIILSESDVLGVVTDAEFATNLTKEGT